LDIHVKARTDEKGEREVWKVKDGVAKARGKEK